METAKARDGDAFRNEILTACDVQMAGLLVQRKQGEVHRTGSGERHSATKLSSHF